MIDFHSHIIPNIDDGSRSIEETCNLIKEAKEAGFDEIVLTSHYIEKYYETDVPERDIWVEVITENLKNRGINTKVYLGNEIYLTDNIMDLLINGKASTVVGNGGWGTAPRTAIGQRKDGIVLMLAIDGAYSDYLNLEVATHDSFSWKDTMVDYGYDLKSYLSHAVNDNGKDAKMIDVIMGKTEVTFDEALSQLTPAELFEYYTSLSGCEIINPITQILLSSYISRINP